ncbi:hypothetical protein FQA39_LY08654 [Lamprigera yunnana]|nr:hypothetical protein FQA39_LY08654 [Lamprigera yunnana]
MRQVSGYLFHKPTLVVISAYVIFCDTNGKRAVNDKSFETKCLFGGCNNTTCSNIIEDEFRVSDHINKAVQVTCSNASITISSSVFKNHILEANWLSAVNESIKIHELTLDGCELSEISSKAFADHPFTFLSILTIVNSNLKVIKREIFDGMNNLNTFAFRSNEYKYELIIEEKAFESVSNTLAVLQMNRFLISEQSLVNLSGERGAYMSLLVKLDLSYNYIKKIPNGAFQKASQIQSLYLRSCGIVEVDEKAFCGSTTVQALYLDENDIETLKPLTFKALTNLNDYGLYLNGNNWQCNCDLQWLKDYYLNEKFINREISLLCSRESEFHEIDFCETTGPTTFEMTSTSGLENSHMTVKCEVRDTVPFFGANVDAVHTVELIIKNSNVILEFQELQFEPLLVKIIISNVTSDSLRNYFLLWFNSNNKTEYGCITPLENNTLIANLNYASSYAFTLVKEGETDISPKASFGFTTSPEWNRRAWILNNDKALVLTVTIICTIFFGCLIVIGTLLCFRRHHKETNNDNSVKLREKEYNYVSEVCTNNEHDKPAYWEPYITESNQGYLTPKHYNYESVKYKPPLSGNISELSLYPNSDVYNNCKCKSSDVWNTSQYKKQGNYKTNRFNRYEELKPPLPPPNHQ